MKQDEVGYVWKRRGLRSRLALIVAIVWSVYELAFLCNIFFYMNIVIYPLTHRAINVGLVCILVLLLYPPCKTMPTDKLRWYDLLPILIIIVGCGYVAVNANALVQEGRLAANTFEIILAGLLFVSVIEATRRTVGWILARIIVFAFFYAVYSDHFPGFLKSSGFPYSMTLGWMYLSPDGFWGMIIGVVSTIVAGFIIFGAFLKGVGAIQFFNDLALACAGSMRGGAAKASVIASTFFGTISGSIAANVATTGQITIPLMKSTGFEPNYAGAVESTASTGGMFMPPVMGATAFLIAEFLQTSYWTVCLAALLPGIAYYATLLLQVDLQAAKTRISGLPKEDLPSLKKTLLGGWQYLLPFALLIFLLGVLRYSAQTTIMYTLGALIVMSCFKRESRLTPRKLLVVLEDSAKGMMQIIPLCAAIGILVGSIDMTGVGTNFTSELLVLSGGSLVIMLLLSAFAAFILGMGMTAVSVYLLTVVLLAPALINAGVEPIAAHLFLFYYGCLSFITPPVCIAAYIAAGISGGNPWKTGFKAMRLGFAAFLVPWIFIFNPSILMIGSVMEIIVGFFLVLLASMSIGIAFEGYFIQALKSWEVTLLIIGSACQFFPSNAVKVAGVASVALFLFSHLVRVRQARNTVTMNEA